MTIKDDWVNIDKDKKTIINDSLHEIKKRLYDELDLNIDEDESLIKVIETHKKYIIIGSLHRIPLKHLTFLEEEGFWFDDHRQPFNPNYPHQPTNKHTYNYIFLREDYIRRDRRFYENNYTPLSNKL